MRRWNVGRSRVCPSSFGRFRRPAPRSATIANIGRETRSWTEVFVSKGLAQSGRREIRVCRKFLSNNDLDHSPGTPEWRVCSRVGRDRRFGTAKGLSNRNLGATVSSDAP